MGRPHHLLCIETLLCGGAKLSSVRLVLLLVVLPKKFEVEFIKDADWQERVMDKEKARSSSAFLAIVVGRANISSLVAQDTVPIWGQLAS